MTSYNNFYFNLPASGFSANIRIDSIPTEYISLIHSYKVVLRNLSFELIRLRFGFKVFIIRKCETGLYEYSFKCIESR